MRHPPERAASPAARQKDPAEAAAEFERILVKQFVRTMTENLFKDSLAGNDGPSWMGAYGDIQRDSLTDVLTEHLVESGTLRMRDLLLRQWSLRSGDAPSVHPDPEQES